MIERHGRVLKAYIYHWDVGSRSKACMPLAIVGMLGRSAAHPAVEQGQVGIEAAGLDGLGVDARYRALL